MYFSHLSFSVPREQLTISRSRTSVCLSLMVYCSVIPWTEVSDVYPQHVTIMSGRHIIYVLLHVLSTRPADARGKWCWLQCQAFDSEVLWLSSSHEQCAVEIIDISCNDCPTFFCHLSVHKYWPGTEIILFVFPIIHMMYIWNFELVLCYSWVMIDWNTLLYFT